MTEVLQFRTPQTPEAPAALEFRPPEQPEENEEIIFRPSKEDQRTFENMRTDKEHIKKIRRVYDEAVTDEEALDQWISDGVWRDQNSYSAIKQFIDFGTADDEESADLAYAFTSWNDMPTIFQEGGRGFFAGLGHNLIAGFADPLSYLGAGIGGVLAKKVASRAANEAAQAASKAILKDGANAAAVAAGLKAGQEVAEKGVKTAGRMALAGGIGGDAVAGGVITGAQEGIAVEADLKDEIDIGNIAMGAAIAGAGAALPSAVVKAFQKYRNRVPDGTGKPTPDSVENVEGYINAVFSYHQEPWYNSIQPMIDRVGTKEWWLEGGMTSGNFRQAIFDLSLPTRRGEIGEDFTDAGLDTKGLRAESKNQYLHNKPMRAVRAALTGLGRTAVAVQYGMIEMKKTNPGDNHWGSVQFIEGRRGIKEMMEDLGDENEWLMFITGFTAHRERLLRDTRQVGGAHIKDYKGEPGKAKMMVTSPATDKQIDSAIEMFDSNPKFVKAAQEFEDLGADILKFRRDTDLISQEDYDRIINLGDANQMLWYMPFFRQEGGWDGAALNLQGSGKTMSNIKGGTNPANMLKINNPLHNLVLEMQNVIQAGFNNVAARTVIDNLQAGGLKDRFLVKMDAEKAMKSGHVELAKGTLKDRLIKAGASEEAVINAFEELGDDQIVLWHRRMKTTGEMGKVEGDGLTVVMREGKLEWWQAVDKTTAKDNADINTGNQLMNMFDAVQRTSPFAGSDKFHKTMRLAQGFKRAFSSSVTSVPTFILTNGTRDTVAGALLNTTAGFTKGANGKVSITPAIPIANLVHGVKTQLVDEKTRREFLLSGAGHSTMRRAEGLRSGNMDTMRGMIPDDQKTMLDKVMTSSRIFDWGKMAKDKYMDALAMGENAVRVTEFKAARDAGMSIEEAGLRAADISTPFHLRGSSHAVQMMTALTPFLNPGMQGIYHVARRFEQDPVRVGMAVGAMTAGTLMLYESNSQHEMYNSLSDDIKDMNWVFLYDKDGWPTFIPGSGEPVDYFLARKPFDLGTAFASFPERIMEQVNRKGEKSLKDVDRVAYHAYRLATTYMSLDMMPYGVGTAVDVMSNENWKGGPIVPRGLQGGLPGMNSRADTAQIYKWIGEQTGFSPLFVEHTMNDMAGSAYKLFMTTVDRGIWREINGEPELPPLDMNKYPVLRAIMGDPLGRTKYETDFYNLMKNTGPYREQMAMDVSSQDEGSFLRMMRDTPFLQEVIGASKATQDAITSLSAANDQRDRVLKDRSLTPEEKKEEIQALRRDTQGMIKDFMEQVYEHEDLELYWREDNLYNSLSKWTQHRWGGGEDDT